MTDRRAIGRFKLDGEVASGASGTIYLAVDPVTGERVALKLIRRLGGMDLARFGREARILAQLGHPGVVRYIEHGRTDAGDAYIVMEWLDGEDLRERLARTGLSMKESVALGARVAGALAALHALGLVHRDIKPGNLFLPGGRAEEVKIIDFGLARGEEPSFARTQTGLVVGTPAYMAPEQARGQREIDGRTDVFSLGGVLFKCITGRAPFLGQSLMAVLTKVLLEEPPRLSDLRPEVPPQLDELVARMLRKDPAARPASAAEVAAALLSLGPLGEECDEAEPAPMSRAFSGLTGGEQRVMAMLFVGTKTGDRGAAPELAALASAHGAQLDQLADGTSVVTLAGSGMATDQAARAARLAMALRAALPGVPMALATGRGDLARRLPVGDAIERAARLLAQRIEAADHAARASLPPPSAIAVDEVTAALLDVRFEVTAGEGGLSLLGLREIDAGARTLLGRTTPMVGREWELSSIETLFGECVEEPLARALIVTGPAGMGKSRLCREAVLALRQRLPEIEVWRGRGDALRSGSALGLLAQVIRSASGIQEGEPPEDRRRRLVDCVMRFVPSEPSGSPPWIRMAEVLGEIVDAPFVDAASEQLRAAWEGFLAAACASRPVLLVLEDLHWADAATVHFVEGALQSLARRPWMVLALARPEVHDLFPRLWAESNPQEIRLKPLPRRAAERLAREALGDAVSDDVVGRVVGKAEGNAFYLEELIRAVSDDDRERQLPETVLAMVEARLDALDPEARRVLRAASVLGEVFWPGAVEALLGGPAPAGWEDALVARELLARRPQSRFAGERELCFRHALLREGAYATLTEADLALGHRLAGEWLEAHGESDAMVIARHFELARG